MRAVIAKFEFCVPDDATDEEIDSVLADAQVQIEEPVTSRQGLEDEQRWSVIGEVRMDRVIYPA